MVHDPMQPGLGGYIIKQMSRLSCPEACSLNPPSQACHSLSQSSTHSARTPAFRMQSAEPSYGGPSRTHMLSLEQDTARHAQPCLTVDTCSHNAANCAEVRSAPIGA